MSSTVEPRSVGICQYCGEVIVDGRADSGASEYDPMTLGGDFGCDKSPESDDESVGSHALAALLPPSVPQGKGAAATDWEYRTETFQVLV